MLILLQFFIYPAQAQVFKWTGPDGKTNYSNVPPPPSVRAENKQLNGNTMETSGLSYEIARSTKLNPVTLYTGQDCAPCDEGRKLLHTRGVPFTEKTVTSNADIALLGKGTVELPQLVVGKTKQSGFDASAWNRLLSAASYPVSNKLSKQYRNPLPQPAAPTLPNAEKEVSNVSTAPIAPAGPGNPPRAAKSPPQTNEQTIPGLRF